MNKEIEQEYLKRINRSYWAGIIDGEGHLKLTTNKRGVTLPRLTLKMTCEETVKAFSKEFCVSYKKRNRTASIKDHWKDQYVSSIEGHKVAYICIALQPYFITKRKEAEEIIKFYQRICLICGCDFWSKYGMKYCGRKCERISFNKRRKLKRKGSLLKTPS